MPKPEWGVKRICSNCSVRFYDMQRQPIKCPKCGTAHDPEKLTKKKRGRPPASESKSTSVPQNGEDKIEIGIDEDLSDLDEGDEVLEDTSDFGEDEKVVEIEPSSDDD